MKILHIVPAYLPAHRYGGPIESVHSLNVALARAGHDVTVFTTDIDGDGRVDAPTNVPVMMDGVRVFYFKGSFPRSWFYSREMCHALRERTKEFDIVHITSVFLSESTLGAHYAKKCKKPYIISPRGSLMRAPLSMSGFKKRLYIALLERRNLRDASAIHFTVPAEEKEYREAGFPLQRAIVVPNSVPSAHAPHNVNKESFRKEWKIPVENKIVLFLGRISPIKGLDTLIPAFADVVKKIKNATLVIAGGDDRGYKAEMEKLVKENGISAQAAFTGMLTGEKKEAMLKSADIFVVSSVSESFGMSAVEAMRDGIATVLTDGVGIAGDAKNVGAAVVVKKNKDELANAIIRLLQNEDERKEFARRGADFVEKEYSEASVANKMTMAYQKIIEGTNHV